MSNPTLPSSSSSSSSLFDLLLQTVPSIIESYTSSSTILATTAALSTIVVVVTAGIYQYSQKYHRHNNKKRQRDETNKCTACTNIDTNNNNDNNADDNNANDKKEQEEEEEEKVIQMDPWEERRQRGIAIHSIHEKKNVQKIEKPFGSSYYYAHNNTQAKGGYTDGLRMEDYTMNKPRLLSVGNTSTCSNSTTTTSISQQKQQQQQQQQQQQTQSAVVSSSTNSTVPNTTTSTSIKLNQRVLTISKYYWDDPGNSNGEATIQIEQLPLNSTEFIKWEDVWKHCFSSDSTSTSSTCTEFVQAQIIKNNNDNSNTNKEQQQGLLVVIQPPPSQQDQEQEQQSSSAIAVASTTIASYRLEINKLYGPVSSVQVIVKRKRILIKIYKKYSIFDRSNLKSWPHPQKKVN